MRVSYWGESNWREIDRLDNVLLLGTIVAVRRTKGDPRLQVRL